MGYRGKVVERQQARRLRRTGLPVGEIAARVGVSKSSVSLWVRDVEFDVPVVRSARGRVDESRLRLVLYLHQAWTSRRRWRSCRR